jgi:LDH2 family malate/lactate/ureidoglycolate dehydrogenase
MSKGMRLMLMMLILAGVITGMMQCAKRTMTHKRAPRELGLKDP